MKFLVHLGQTRYYHSSVWVDAADQEEAKNLALAKSEELDWIYDNYEDSEVFDIEEVDMKGLRS